MDFSEISKARRSIRRFKEKEVDRDLIQEIINEAVMAPNAGNDQPWKFCVVNDRKMMKKISDDSKKTILKRIENNPVDYARKYEGILKKESYNVFYNAPSLILIYGDESKRNLLVDCALLASYIMFSAVSKGLGTCWINLGAHFQDKEIKKLLNIEDCDKIVAPLIIGYPDQKPSPPKRREPVIHFYPDK